MLRLIVILTFTVCTAISVIGQSAGRDYWTKTVLATESTCKLRIGDGVFSPSESRCSYYGHLPADTKVFLESITRSRPWAKLKLRTDSGETFTVEISNQNKSVFDRIFNSFFTSGASDEHYPDCNGTVLKDFMTSVGFPDTIARRGNEEKWSLSYGHFSTQRCGFDVADLEFRAGKLESLSGSI